MREPGSFDRLARMPEPALPDSLRDEVARLGKADIMVGIPSFKNAATIGYVVRAAQAGLVQYFPDLRPVVVNADANSPDGTQRVVVETEPPDYVERILLVRPRNRLQRISLTYPEVDGVGGKGAALRTIFQIADALGVQALVVVDSDLRSIVPEWIELLAGPILVQVGRHDHQHRHLPADTLAVRTPYPPADRGRLRRLGGPGPPLPGA
jgi:glycosyltransferase involved in cell wall biosynthesis